MGGRQLRVLATPGVTRLPPRPRRPTLLDRWRFSWARTRSPGTIRAASAPTIDPPFRLRLAPGASLVLGRDVHFSSGFTAYVEREGVLEIGDRTSFGVNCWLGLLRHISIGSDCSFGPMVTATDGNQVYGRDEQPFFAQG